MFHRPFPSSDDAHMAAPIESCPQDNHARASHPPPVPERQDEAAARRHRYTNRRILELWERRRPHARRPPPLDGPSAESRAPGAVVVRPPSPPPSTPSLVDELLGAAQADATWEQPRLKPCACCAQSGHAVVPRPPSPARETRGWKRHFRNWAGVVRAKMGRVMACILGKEGCRGAKAEPHGRSSYTPPLESQRFQSVKALDSLATLVN